MLKRIKNFLNSFAALIVAFFALFIPAFSSSPAAPNGLSANLTFDDFVAGISSRSANLVYISETDSDVVAWYRTRVVESLSIAEFKRVARLPTFAEVETRSFDQFFTPSINSDPSGQWEILREYIENNTTQATVFRVRRTGEESNYYDVYAVGLFDGKVVGIHVLSLET